MPTSSVVSQGDLAVADHINNVRTDVLSTHTHDGTDGNATIEATSFTGTATYTGASLTFGDEDLLKWGTGGDIVSVNRSTALSADAAFSGVFVGTPDHPGVAANSLVISNVTTDGDLLFAVSDGGTSKGLLKLDGANGKVTIHGGDLEVAEALTVTGATTLNGNVTLGNAASDVITVNGTVAGANALIFEGATADGSEITLAAVDPTSDHTIYMPNQGGYLGVFDAASTTQITSTPAELNLIDGGTARGTTGVASGDGILINDAGTMRMTNVDTVSTYFSSHNVGGGNIVTTGALDSGSITSGFGTIDTGSSTITTTGLISGGSLDIDNVLINGTTIGHTDDTDLITVADGALTIAGTIGSGAITSTGIVTGTGFTAGSAVLAESELELLDGLTAGTAIASKVVTTDASIDTSGQRNLTITGELDAATLDISGIADIAGTLTLGTVAAAGSDVDKFLVLDGSGNVDYRTGTQVASDIGAQTGSTAADDIGTGDGAVNLVTTSGNITIDAQANDADVIIKVDDNGSAVTAVTFDGSDEGNAIFVNDIKLNSDSALISFGADGDTTLTHTDGSGLTLNSTNKIMFNDASQFIQGASATVLDIAATDEIELTATLIDVVGNFTNSGTIASTGVITANAGVVVDNITIDGTEIDLSSGSLTVDVAANIILDSGAGITIFQDAGGEILRFTEGNSGDVTVKLATNAKDLIFTDNGDAAGLTIKDAQGGIIVPGEVMTTKLSYTDGDDALTIADGGGLTVAQDMTMADGTSVIVDATPGTDHYATGLKANMLAGAAIAQFELVYIHSDGDLQLADASATGTMPAIGIATAAISDTATGEILLRGFVRDDTWNWTPGGRLYVSETSGAVTQTAPSDDGDFIQVVGIALTADIGYFTFDTTTIESAG